MLPQANSFILQGEAGQLNLYVSNPRTSYVLSEFMNCSWFDINLPGITVASVSGSVLFCGVHSFICEGNAHKYVGCRAALHFNLGVILQSLNGEVCFHYGVNTHLS